MTKAQLVQMEGVQRRATKIMLQNYDMPYVGRLEICELPMLKTRWETMLNNFAMSFLNSKRMDHWLIPSEQEHSMQLRTKRTSKEPKCRTERYRKCTTNTVIRILNGDQTFAFNFENDSSNDANHI